MKSSEAEVLDIYRYEIIDWDDPEVDPDPATNNLLVQNVIVGSTEYYNAAVSVSALDSIGSVSGADSYDGSQLTISAVQVGGTTYHNAVITVAGIVSLQGGMPKAALDVYDLATKQLSIAAVEFNNHVYTNVVIKVGTIISVTAAQASPSLAASPSAVASPDTVSIKHWQIQQRDQSSLDN